MDLEQRLDAVVDAAMAERRIVGAVRMVRRRGTNRWGGIYGHNWFFDPSQELSVVSMSNTGLEGCDGPFKDQVRDAVYAGL